jgi:hypothetical protein
MTTNGQESLAGNPQVGELRFAEDMPIQAYKQLLDNLVSTATAAEDFYKVGLYDNTFINLQVDTKRPPAESWWVQKLSADFTAD